MENFDLVVEGKSDDPLTVVSPDLHLVNLSWHKANPPDVLVMPGGLMLIKVGRYATVENKYSYRVADVAKLVAGKLVSD